MTSHVKSVEVEEFRDHLEELLNSNQTLAITRDGRTIGYYQRAHHKPSEEDMRLAREANAELQAMLERLGITEDDVIRDFQALRKSR
jgi:hypothetical protein